MKQLRIKKNSFPLISLTVVLLILLMAPMKLAAQEVYKARLSYHWFPDHDSAKMANLFAEECKKATNGRLDIEIFPSGQLFKIGQIIPAISQGSVEMGGVVGIMYMRIDKDFYLMGFQRFFNSFEQARGFWLEDPEGRKAWDRLENKLGVKNLCYIPVGPATYFSVDRPLDKIANFEGLKARTLLATEKPGLEALGVNYVAVSTAEVYSALKQGMINMVSTVPNGLIAYNWWDFLKYAQQPYTFYGDAYITVNTAWWNTLPQDIRDIVMNQVAPKISKLSTEGIMKISNDILKELVEKHGGHISTVSGAELQKFIDLERTKVHPALAKEINPDLYKAAKKYVGIE